MNKQDPGVMDRVEVSFQEERGQSSLLSLSVENCQSNEMNVGSLKISSREMKSRRITNAINTHGNFE